MRYYLLTFLLFYVAEVTGAIIGITVDRDTGAPLPFTNIAVSGKSFGTVSNADGYFVLDQEGLMPEDTLLFSHVGYETLKISALDLKGKSKVYLQPAAMKLNEVAVYARQLTAEEIIDRVRENYPVNHPAPSHRQRVFFHQYEKTPWPDENQIILKKSDFTGLDPKTFKELFQRLPDEFIEYQDALADLYSHQGNHKLKPIAAISLEESAMEDIGKEMEKELDVFLEDIEQTNRDADTYFKFRTGIISIKDKSGPESSRDSVWTANKNDSANYHVHTGQVKNNITGLMYDYAHIESKNWEFINKTNKYDYELGDMTIFAEELVYPVSFVPGRGGLFEGVMYVSATTFAILQLNFAFASGKSSENIQLFGFGHSMDFKKGRVIFERGKTGYFVKYVYAEQHETASIERSFSIMKKEKRFLWDKTLNEIKLEVQLHFDIHHYRELLVLDREPVSQQQFDTLSEPPSMKFKKEYAYTSEMWNDRTVIAPTAELKKYTRKEE